MKNVIRTLCLLCAISALAAFIAPLSLASTPPIGPRATTIQA